MQKNERRKTQANISPILLSRQWLDNSLIPSLTFEANIFSTLFPSSSTTYVRQSNKYTEWNDENGNMYKVTADGEVLDEDFESDESDPDSDEDEDGDNLPEEDISNKNRSTSVSLGRKYSINPPSRDRRRSSFSPRLSQLNPSGSNPPNNPAGAKNNPILNTVAEKLKKKLNKSTSSVLPNFILSPEKLNNKNFSALDFLKLSPAHIYTPPSLSGGIISIENSSTSSSSSSSSNAIASFVNSLPPPPSIDSDQIYRSLYIHCNALLELIDEAKKLDQYEKMIKNYQAQQQKMYETKQETKEEEYSLPLHTRISECIFRILLYHQEKVHDEYFIPPNHFEEHMNKMEQEEKMTLEKEDQERRQSIMKTPTSDNALIMRSNFSSSRRGSRRLSSFSNPSFQPSLATISDSLSETKETPEAPQVQEPNLSSSLHPNAENTTNFSGIPNSGFFYNNFLENPPPLLNYHHVLFFSHLHDKYYQKQQKYLIEQEKKIKTLEKDVILTKHQLSIARISTSSLDHQNRLLLLTHEEKIKSYERKIKLLESKNKIIETECEKWRLLFHGGHNEVDTRGDLIIRPGAKDSSNNSIVMMSKMLMMTINNIMNFLTRSIINYKKRIHEEDTMVKILTKEELNPSNVNLDSSLSSSQAFPSFGSTETFDIEKHNTTDLVLESMSGSFESIMLLSNRLMGIVEETHGFKQLSETQNSNISLLKTKLKITIDKKEDVEYENNLLKSTLMKLITYIEKSDFLVSNITFSNYTSNSTIILDNLIDQEIHDFLRETLVINEEVIHYFSPNNQIEKKGKKDGVLCEEIDDTNINENTDTIDNSNDIIDNEGNQEENTCEGVFTTTDMKEIEKIESKDDEVDEKLTLEDYYDRLNALISQDEEDQVINLFKTLLSTILAKIQFLENSMNDRINKLKFCLKDFFSQLQSKFFDIMKHLKDRLDIVENNLLISRNNEEKLKDFIKILLKNEALVPLGLHGNSLEEVSDEDELTDESIPQPDNFSTEIKNNESMSMVDMFSSHIEHFIGPFEEWSKWKSVQLVDYSTIVYSNSFHNFSSLSNTKKYHMINLQDWLTIRHSEFLNSLLRNDSLNYFSNTLFLTSGKAIHERDTYIKLYENLTYNYEILSQRNTFFAEEVFNKVDMINLINRQTFLDYNKLKKKFEVIQNRYYMLVEDFPQFEMFRDYSVNINSHPLYLPEVFEYNSNLLKDIDDQKSKIEDLESFLEYMKNKSTNQNEIEEKLEMEIENLKEENEKLKASLLKLSKKKSKNSEKQLASTISTPALPSSSKESFGSVSQSTSSLNIPLDSSIPNKSIIDSKKIVQSNIEIKENFQPFNQQEVSIDQLKTAENIKTNQISVIGSAPPTNSTPIISNESTHTHQDITNTIPVSVPASAPDIINTSPPEVSNISPEPVDISIHPDPVVTNSPPDVIDLPPCSDSPTLVPEVTITTQSSSVTLPQTETNIVQVPVKNLVQQIVPEKVIKENIEKEVLIENDEEEGENDDEEQENDKAIIDEYDSDEDQEQKDKILKLTVEVKSLKLFFSKERLRIIKFYEEEIKTLKHKLREKELFILHNKT